MSQSLSRENRSATCFFAPHRALRVAGSADAQLSVAVQRAAGSVGVPQGDGVGDPAGTLTAASPEELAGLGSGAGWGEAEGRPWKARTGQRPVAKCKAILFGSGGSFQHDVQGIYR